jgi:uncharacterized protein YecA (UPF0149 family)
MKFVMKILEKLFGSSNGTGMDQKELGRNDLCWCGSGKKYKKCHLEKDEKKAVKKYEKNRRV